jgi:translation initiation factor IF-3
LNTFRRSRTPQTKAPPKDLHRINELINAREVRVIDNEGEQLGIMPLREALDLAERKGLDLVEIAESAKPPVCRLMDYGKFKYKEQKKETEAKKKQTKIQIKELRIRYRTDHADLDTKLRKAKEFLLEGDKVKFSMRFKGREVMYVDLGEEKFNEIVSNLSDISYVDEKSPMAGRQVYIILAPNKEVLSKAQAAAAIKNSEEAGKADNSPEESKDIVITSSAKATEFKSKGLSRLLDDLDKDL